MTNSARLLGGGVWRRGSLVLATAAVSVSARTGCTAIEGVRNQISERFSGGEGATQPAAPQHLNAESLPVKTEPPSLTLQIEQNLAALGYDPGPVDGN